MEGTHLPPRQWFEAATLLDAFYAGTSCNGTVVEHVPATCMAVLSILLKADSASSRHRLYGPHNLQAHASQLVQWLRSLGYKPDEVTSEEIMNQEVVVLAGLRWQINLPSLESWVATFCTRFNVLTRGGFLPSLAWAWERMMLFARAAVMQKPASRTLLPRRVAAGLMCLGLARARLLQVEALLHPSMDAKALEAFNWQDGCSPSPPQKQPQQQEGQQQHQQQEEGAPAMAVEPEQAERVLELLKVVTCLDLPALQEACSLVVEVMTDKVGAHKADK
jgi:hypothetical protein